VIFAFSSSGEGNGGGGFCSMVSRAFRDQKVARKSIMAKTRVNLTPECGIRSSTQRSGEGIDVARLQPNSAL
jgi:hypothetical protein